MDSNAFKESLQKRAFIAGQPIIDEEDNRVLYIVVSGKVDAYDTLANLIDSYSAGRYFNARDFFFGDDEITFIAHTDTMLYAVETEALLYLLRAYPQIGYSLLLEAYATPDELPHIEKRLTALHIPSVITQIQLALAGAKTIDNRSTEMPAAEYTAKRQAAAPVETAAMPVHAPAPMPITATVPNSSAHADAVSKEMAATEDMPGFAFPSYYLKEHKGYPNITHPEYKKLVFEKEYSCPCCGTQFQDYRVFASKLITEKPLRYDLRQYHKDFQLEWYDIVTCRTCYFSTFSNLFLEPKNFSKSMIVGKLKEAQNECKLDFDKERDIEFVIASHYLALISAPAFLTHLQIKARIWSNLSWLYEDTADEAIAKLAALQAAEAYEKLFTETKLGTSQEQYISLAVAGMLYRAGELKDIRRWLLQVKRIKDGKKQYVDLADDMVELLHTVLK